MKIPYLAKNKPDYYKFLWFWEFNSTNTNTFHFKNKLPLTLAYRGYIYCTNFLNCNFCH